MTDKSHVVLSMEDYHTLVHQSEQFKEYVNMQMQNSKPIGVRKSNKVFDYPQFVYVFESNEIIDELKEGIAKSELVINDMKAIAKKLRSEKEEIVRQNNELVKENERLQVRSEEHQFSVPNWAFKVITFLFKK